MEIDKNWYVIHGPITVLCIDLPEGVTLGSIEAEGFFARAVADVKVKHSDEQFNIVPMGFRQFPGEINFHVTRLMLYGSV